MQSDRRDSQSTKLLDTELMKRLEQLSITSKRIFSGNMKGHRRSTKRGSSVEFADYRDYQPGDDFRFIDWNIYARLDKLFLKTFVEEENIYIHILLDNSASMSFGNPPKLDYGKRIAAALGYVGLVNLDMVAVNAFAETLNGMRPVRGKDQIFTLMGFLESIKSSSESAHSLMDTCLKRYAFASMHQGIAIVISDFLVPQTVYEEALKSLIYKNFDLNVIHVMSDDELHPTISGELRLRDAETGETKEITITDRILQKYQNRLAEFCNRLEQFCASMNITYLRISTSLPFEDLILKSLRKENILH